MTACEALNRMVGMNRHTFGVIALLGILAAAVPGFAQKDKDEGPTSWLYFSVIKDDNGKPVRNAAIILHPVDTKGKQERGDLELKTDPDGKTSLDGIPYGTLRVQVLARGFQTYGEDFDISQPRTDITIKMKQPRGQYSVYDDQAKDPQPKPDSSPSDQKKPN